MIAKSNFFVAANRLDLNVPEQTLVKPKREFGCGQRLETGVCPGICDGVGIAAGLGAAVEVGSSVREMLPIWESELLSL